MSEPFLILHKVRGEPAFDVATKIACPVCQQGEYPMCVECNEEGFWWIIPTSGHRAYPYWNIPLGALMHDTDESANMVLPIRTLDDVPELPKDWPDHYPTKSSPEPKSPSLIGVLANLVPRTLRR